MSKKTEAKVKATGPLFVGMDPSYNGFAIVIVNSDGDMVDRSLMSSNTKDEAEDRIIQLEKGFQYIAKLVGLNIVYIEGPSYASNGAFMLQMGALHYYLRIFFRKNNVPFTVITPGTLKKFVCGTGNAKKELMLLKTYKKFGVEFDDNNLCDAYGLARLALHDYDNVIQIESGGETNDNTEISKQNSGNKGNKKE